MNAAQSDTMQFYNASYKARRKAILIKVILELSMRMTRDWITGSFININVPCNLMSSDFD